MQRHSPNAHVAHKMQLSWMPDLHGWADCFYAARFIERHYADDWRRWKKAGPALFDVSRRLGWGVA